MKLKYYLRGLGTGLLVATLLLWIVGSVKESNTALKDTLGENTTQAKESVKETTTVSESGDTTDKSGGQTETTDKETQKATEQTTDKETQKATEHITVKTDENTTKDTGKKTGRQDDTDEDMDSAKAEVEITTALPEGATVILDIYSGMSSNQVARQLEQLGVIDDNIEFNDYIESKRLQNSIAVGRYEISQNDTYDDIISKITRR